MSEFEYGGKDPSHTLVEQAILAESTFTASIETDLASDATINLDVENPDSNENSFLFFFGDMAHEDESTLDVWSRVSGVSGGSEPDDVHNNFVGSNESPTANVVQDVSFTGEELHQSQVYIGSGVTQIFDGYKLGLPPGESVVVEVTNNGSGNSETGLRISWAELPF